MADNYLITGYWGEPHVTPENDRGINASIFGTGKFVLPVGERFRAELVGNNTLRLYDGKLMINGAAAGIPAGEYVDLSVPYASQGMMRSDIVVFQYEKDPSTLVETGKFVVVHGEEVPFPTEPGDNSTPPDPALTTDNLLSDKATLDQFPMWRIIVGESSMILNSAYDGVDHKLFSLRPNSTFNSFEELGISDADMQAASAELVSDGQFNENILTIIKAMPSFSKLKMVVSEATPKFYDSIVGKFNVDTFMKFPFLSSGTKYLLAVEISKGADTYTPARFDVLINDANVDMIYSCIFDLKSDGTFRCSKFAPSYTAGAAPAMKEGVEYVTDEYWGGKVLYTQLLAISSWAKDGTIDYPTGTGPHVVRYSGNIGGYALPFVHSTLDNAYSCWVALYNNSGKLRLQMRGGSNMAGKSGHVQIWYTK